MPEPLLRVTDLHVAYRVGRSRQARRRHVLHGVSFSAAVGSVSGVEGPNGAGKTTLLRAVAGLLGLHGGRITSGSVDIGGAGRVAYVLAGRRVFRDLTVDENLRAGTYGCRDRRRARARVDEVVARFPLLAVRRTTPAGLLSGGEQQLLTIARALVREPDVLLLDEPTSGLAADAIALVEVTLRDVADRGTAVVVADLDDPRVAVDARLRLVEGRVSTPLAT